VRPQKISEKNFSIWCSQFLFYKPDIYIDELLVLVYLYSLFTNSGLHWFLFVWLRLTPPTPGIEIGGRIEVCDFSYEFCVNNHGHSHTDRSHNLADSYFRKLRCSWAFHAGHWTLCNWMMVFSVGVFAGARTRDRWLTGQHTYCSATQCWRTLYFIV